MRENFVKDQYIIFALSLSLFFSFSLSLSLSIYIYIYANTFYELKAMQKITRFRLYEMIKYYFGSKNKLS